MQAVMRSEQEIATLVRENQNLVHYQVARIMARFRITGIERDDLVSWGMLGLVKAAKVWDPQRAGAFSTLACRAIDQMIRRGLGQEWKSTQHDAISLDSLLTEDESTSERYSDRLIAEDDVEAAVVQMDTHHEVRRALDCLKPSARNLIERNYFDGVPLAHIAEEWGVSRQALVGRRARALRDLRQALAPATAAAA